MDLLRLIWFFLRGLLLSRSAAAVEILALRHQLLVLKRSVKRPRWRTRDRLFWVGLSLVVHLIFSRCQATTPSCRNDDPRGVLFVTGHHPNILPAASLYTSCPPALPSDEFFGKHSRTASGDWDTEASPRASPFRPNSQRPFLLVGSRALTDLL
jgi:hypothetical protein